MPRTATHTEQGNTTEATLFMRFDLRDKTWQLGCTTGPGHTVRARTVPAREPPRGLAEIASATRRVGLPETAPIVSGDAAGRAGLWRHRFFEAHGITNHGGDSSAIAGSRRQRRANSEGLDGRKLLRKLLRRLMRYAQGAPQVWQGEKYADRGLTTAATEKAVQCDQARLVTEDRRMRYLHETLSVVQQVRILPG